MPYTKIIAVGGVLGLAFNFWLAKQASYIGAAWAWLLTEISIALIMYVYLRRRGIRILDARFFNYNFIKESVQPIWQTIKGKMVKTKNVSKPF